jgi:hypothetical protein
MSSDNRKAEGGSQKAEVRAGSVAIGRGWFVLVCAVLLVGGLIVWVSQLSAGPEVARRALRGLLISFAYFTPLAAGMVVWPAVVMLSRGRWMGGVERPALAAAGQGPLSLVVLAVLAVTAKGIGGAPGWASWLYVKDLHQGSWLGYWPVFIRDGAALAALWVLAAVFARCRRKGKSPKVLAGVLTVSYCLVISLIGFDLVMALDPHWYSTLFGGYFFISGMYAACAAWTLAALLTQKAVSRAQMHDLGKLIVTFSLLTTYLMYGQLLPIWYENLPAEVRFVIPRLGVSNWQFVSLALLSTIYLGPLVLLLTVWAKRSKWFLGAICCLVLVGMWVERWWLIAPTPDEGHGVPALLLGWPELSIAAALAGAFALIVNGVNRRLTREMAIEEPGE